MPTPPAGDPDELDPTGVRELLAGLPDPGPMPADLVRRIEARLEVERAHRDGAAGTPGLSDHADRVVDLAAERSRRRPARTLALVGAAAAGLVVTTATLGQWLGATGTPDSGVAARYPAPPSVSSSFAGGSREDAVADEAVPDEAAAGTAQSGAGAEAGAADAAADAADDAADAGDSAPAAGDEGQTEERTGMAAQDDSASGLTSTTPAPAGPLLPRQVVVLPGLGPVDEHGYGELMLRLAQQDVDEIVLGVGDLTPLEATACWQGLAEDPGVEEVDFERYLAARADLSQAGGERREVVALLGLDASGSGLSWAVSADCVTGEQAQVLSGPHQVG